MFKARAFAAGVIGASAVIALLALMSILGVRIDWIMFLGSLVTHGINPSTWLLGFFIHLAVGGILGWGYAALFEYWFHDAGWGPGLRVALVHALVVGVLLGFAPKVNPLVPKELPAPGFFMSALGARGVALFVLVHLLYGVVVGLVYGNVRREHRRSWFRLREQH